MSSDPADRAPREEYADLVRAVAAHVELEGQFGIEAAELPPPAAPRPAAALPRPGSPKPRPTSTAPRPAAAPPAAAPRHVAASPKSREMFGPKEYSIQPLDGLSKQEQLDFLAQHIADCTLCRLCEGRTQVVYGAGNPDADLMFIGEAPGRDEDIQGEPFIGRAGQLLTRIIEAMDMKREDVYITNICLCRPPNNRAPQPDEMDACLPFLHQKIDIIQPKIICLLGATAVRGLLKEKTGITRLRGTFLEWRGVLVMPTYHPAYLLRNPNAKRDVWADVQKVRDTLRGT